MMMNTDIQSPNRWIYSREMVPPKETGLVLYCKYGDGQNIELRTTYTSSTHTNIKSVPSKMAYYWFPIPDIQPSRAAEKRELMEKFNSLIELSAKLDLTEYTSQLQTELNNRIESIQ